MPTIIEQPAEAVADLVVFVQKRRDPITQSHWQYRVVCSRGDFSMTVYNYRRAFDLAELHAQEHGIWMDAAAMRRHIQQRPWQ